MHQKKCGDSRSAAEGGQTVLPLVLLIGSMIALIALTMVFLSRTFLTSSYGFQISERARAVATSGVYDALMRLVRNKDVSGAYSVVVGEHSADVTITQDSPGSGQATISSVSIILNHPKKVTVVVSRPTSTGQIVLTSWQYTQ